MYNIDFECKYYLEKSDELYRTEILKAFEMDEWDDKIMNDKMDTLYHHIKDCDFVTDLIKKLKENKEFSVFMYFISQDGGDDAVFRIIFNFDYFHLFHSVLCYYIRYNELNDELFKKLANII